MERALIEVHPPARRDRGPADPRQPVAAAAVAALAEMRCGAGHVKEKNLAKASRSRAERLEAFRNPSQVVMMKRA